MRMIEGQGNLPNSWFITIGSVLVILALVWGVLYALLLNEAAPGGDLFKLLILIVSAYFAGQVNILRYLYKIRGFPVCMTLKNLLIPKLEPNRTKQYYCPCMLQ